MHPADLHVRKRSSPSDEDVHLDFTSSEESVNARPAHVDGARSSAESAAEPSDALSSLDLEVWLVLAALQRTYCCRGPLRIPSSCTELEQQILNRVTAGEGWGVGVGASRGGDNFMRLHQRGNCGACMPTAEVPHSPGTDC